MGGEWEFISLNNTQNTSLSLKDKGKKGETKTSSSDSKKSSETDNTEKSSETDDSDKSTETKNKTKNEKPKIAIIDCFETQQIDINGDTIQDVGHGVCVESYIKSTLPDAEIDRFNLQGTSSGSIVIGSLNEQLKEVIKSVKKGQDYDAVNLSLGTFLNYEGLSQDAGIEITAENINDEKVKAKALEALRREDPTTYEVIQLINQLTSMGVECYIASGNTGQNPNLFSAYSLTDGAHIVGATDANGNVTDYSTKNSSVSDYAQGTYEKTAIYDENNQLSGYDITGDGIVDIDADDLFQTGFTMQPKNSDNSIKGTSFATPSKLAEDLKNLYYGENEESKESGETGESDETEETGAPKEDNTENSKNTKKDETLNVTTLEHITTPPINVKKSKNTDTPKVDKVARIYWGKVNGKMQRIVSSHMNY